MTEDTVMDIMQLAVQTIIYAVAPPLLTGLVIGLTVSILQTITSVSEQTLASICKILGVFSSLIIFGPFIMSNIKELFLYLYSNLASFVK